MQKRNSSRGLSLVEVMMYVVVAGIVVSISVSSLGAARQRSYSVDGAEAMVGFLQNARAKAVSGLEVDFGSVECAVSEFRVAVETATVSGEATTLNLYAVPPTTGCSATNDLLLESKPLHASIEVVNPGNPSFSAPLPTVGYVPPEGTVTAGASFTFRSQDGRFPKTVTVNGVTGIAEVD